MVGCHFLATECTVQLNCTQPSSLHTHSSLSLLACAVTMAVFISAIFLFSLKTGFCVKQISTCRPVCINSDCINLNQDKLDFQAAEKACDDRGGELATFQTEAAVRVLGMLSQDLPGDVWIGLRLPAGTCSNLSTPLRGYKWTSPGLKGSFVPSLISWTDNLRVCSPHCVSVSSNLRWTERPCLDTTDGYLCRTAHKDACQVQERSDSIVFKSPKGCLTGPCEHYCTEVKGGFKCSCFTGYIPDSKDPKRCTLHCAQEKCPVICDFHTGESCHCPEGFIRSDNLCHDINECLMEGCEHECHNTYGSFTCLCREGFVPKDTVKCVNAPHVVTGVVKPTTTTNNSSASSGSFLWLWIFITLVVVASIFVIRFYVVRKQKCRSQACRQKSSVSADTAEA